MKLSKLNMRDVQGYFENAPIHPFLNFCEPVETENFRVKNLYWQNIVDQALPYQTGFQDKFWNVSKALLLF